MTALMKKISSNSTLGILLLVDLVL